MGIQRFDFFDGFTYVEGSPRLDGDYVLYSDHIQVVHENGQEAAALMLESVRGSLREWPTAGCDIEVAKAVVAIRDAAIKATLQELLEEFDGDYDIAGWVDVCRRIERKIKA